MLVQIPDIGLVSFPDEMDQAAIEAAIKNKLQSPDPVLPASQELPGFSNIGFTDEEAQAIGRQDLERAANELPASEKGDRFGVEKFAQGLATGVAKTGLDIARLPTEVLNFLAQPQATVRGEPGRDWFDSLKGQIQPIIEASSQIAKESNGPQWMQAAGEGIGGFIPFIAASAIPAVGPAAGLAAFPLAAYGSRKAKVEEFFKDSGLPPEEIEKTATTQGMLAAFVQGAIAKWVPESLAKLPGGRYLHLTKEGAEQAVEGATATASAAQESIKRVLGGALNNFALGSAIGIQDAVQDKLTTDPKLTFGEALGNVLESGLTLAALGTAAHAPMEAARLFGGTTAGQLYQDFVAKSAMKPGRRTAAEQAAFATTPEGDLVNPAELFLGTGKRAPTFPGIPDTQNFFNRTILQDGQRIGVITGSDAIGFTVRYDGQYKDSTVPYGVFGLKPGVNIRINPNVTPPRPPEPPPEPPAAPPVVPPAVPTPPIAPALAPIVPKPGTPVTPPEGEPHAIQEQIAAPEVLGVPQPEVGLPQVGGGNAGPETPATASQPETQAGGTKKIGVRTGARGEAKPAPPVIEQAPTEAPPEEPMPQPSPAQPPPRPPKKAPPAVAEPEEKAAKGATADNSSRLADWIAGKIATGEKFDWRELFAKADEHFGGTQAEGLYTPKDAYDAMELGINRFIRGNPGNYDPRLDPAVARQVVLNLKERLDKIPTQTKRTAEQDEFQQFSTPPTLAYVAAWLAKLRPEDKVLEPSAGVGGLAVFAKNAGATVYGNELSQRRRGLLEKLGIDQVFGENAEQLNNILPNEIRPTVVLMNPPFSSTAGRMEGVRRTMNATLHLDQALARLEPGGRLIAIVGEGMAADRPTFREWWRKTAERYNVRANVGINGEEYAKYGTTFDNQIIVIDKTGPTTEPPITGKVQKIEDLLPLLEGVRNQRSYEAPAQTPIPAAGRPAAPEQGPAQPAGPKMVGVRTGKAGPKPAPQLPANALGAGQREGAPEERPGLEPTVEPAGRPAAETGNVVPPPEQRPSLGQPGRAPETGLGPKPEPAGGGEPALGSVGQPERGESGKVVGGKETLAAETKIDPNVVFEDYKPQTSVPNSKPHPTPLSESAAMASVRYPPPKYKARLPVEVIAEGRLSDAQLEALLLAGQAHQGTLPNGERRGFFIGDSMGVGKGRTIAGIIWDSLNRGNRKAIWISKNDGLANDARRDMEDVGVPLPIIEHRKFKLDKNAPIEAKEGVLFSNYRKLSMDNEKKAGAGNSITRWQQIADWAGKDFDGVLVFDEAHQMGNAMDTKGTRGKKAASEMAKAAIELQRALPKAKVVYVSATGATELSNLAYAERLGIWGDQTPFPDRANFINQVSGGGVAAMEAVAKDLKSMGLYLARSLSFAGVKQSKVEQILTPEQRQMYDTFAESWQVVLRNINAALDITGRDGRGRGNATGAFWGAHLRFFNQILTTLQMPEMLKSMQADLDRGESVVIQLVNTHEAAQERAASEAVENDTPLEELDITPRDILMQFVEKSFPVNQYEPYTDADGNERTRIVVDSAGNPVLNQEAVAMRDALLNRLASMNVPQGPLDLLIDHFGAANIAEVTGRGRRLVWKDTPEGRKRVWEERGEKANRADMKAFADKKKRVLVFSDAGGTGASYHADKRFINQEKRNHYVAQPGWRADNAIQGLGRSHRSNQAVPPEFKLVTTDLPGQKRFISTIARRIEQLGALTKGQRETAGQGMFDARDNLESSYAKEALKNYLRDLASGKIPGAVELQHQMGLQILDPLSGEFTGDKIEIRQFLNRLLSLKTDWQDKVFRDYSERLDAVIEYHRSSGTLDQGMETLTAQHTRLKNDVPLWTDPNTGTTTHLVTLELTHPTKFSPWQRSWESGTEFVQNKRSGMLWKLSPERTRALADGTQESFYTAQNAFGRYQTLRRAELENFDRLESTEQAKRLWNEAIEKAPKTYTEDAHMISGTILPIWDRVGQVSRIVRAQTDDGKRFLGMWQPESALPALLRNFNIESKFSATPEQTASAIMDRGATAQLANGWRLARRTVSGQDRIELTGPGFEHQGELQRAGLIAERIAFKMRYFVPTGPEAAGVIEKLVRTRPVVALEGGERYSLKQNEKPTQPTAAGRRSNIDQSYPAPAVEGSSKSAGVGELPSEKARTGAEAAAQPVLDATVERMGATAVGLEEVKAAFPDSLVAHTAVEWPDGVHGEGFFVRLPNGKSILVDPFRETIAFDLKAAAAAYGVSPEDLQHGYALGKYRTDSPEVGIIELLKTSGPDTLSHEKFHALFELALGDQDRAAILKRYGTEEIAAEAFRRSEGFTRGFWEKFKAFIERMANLFRGDAFAKLRQLSPDMTGGTPHGAGEHYSLNPIASREEFEKMTASEKLMHPEDALFQAKLFRTITDNAVGHMAAGFAALPPEVQKAMPTLAGRLDVVKAGQAAADRLAGAPWAPPTGTLRQVAQGISPDPWAQQMVVALSQNEMMNLIEEAREHAAKTEEAQAEAVNALKSEQAKLPIQRMTELGNEIINFRRGQLLAERAAAIQSGNLAAENAANNELGTLSGTDPKTGNWNVAPAVGEVIASMLKVVPDTLLTNPLTPREDILRAWDAAKARVTVNASPEVVASVERTMAQMPDIAVRLNGIKNPEVSPAVQALARHANIMAQAQDFLKAAIAHPQFQENFKEAVDLTGSRALIAKENPDHELSWDNPADSNQSATLRRGFSLEDYDHNVRSLEKAKGWFEDYLDPKKNPNPDQLRAAGIAAQLWAIDNVHLSQQFNPKTGKLLAGGANPFDFFMRLPGGALDIPEYIVQLSGGESAAKSMRALANYAEAQRATQKADNRESVQASIKTLKAIQEHKLDAATWGLEIGDEVAGSYQNIGTPKKRVGDKVLGHTITEQDMAALRAQKGFVDAQRQAAKDALKTPSGAGADIKIRDVVGKTGFEREAQPTSEATVPQRLAQNALAFKDKWMAISEDGTLNDAAKLDGWQRLLDGEFLRQALIGHIRSFDDPQYAAAAKSPFKSEYIRMMREQDDTGKPPFNSLDELRDILFNSQQNLPPDEQLTKSQIREKVIGEINRAVRSFAADENRSDKLLDPDRTQIRVTSAENFMNRPRGRRLLPKGFYTYTVGTKSEQDQVRFHVMQVFAQRFVNELQAHDRALSRQRSEWKQAIDEHRLTEEQIRESQKAGENFLNYSEIEQVKAEVERLLEAFRTYSLRNMGQEFKLYHVLNQARGLAANAILQRAPTMLGNYLGAAFQKALLETTMLRSGHSALMRFAPLGATYATAKAITQHGLQTVNAAIGMLLNQPEISPRMKALAAYMRQNQGFFSKFAGMAVDYAERQRARVEALLEARIMDEDPFRYNFQALLKFPTSGGRLKAEKTTLRQKAGNLVRTAVLLANETGLPLQLPRSLGVSAIESFNNAMADKATNDLIADLLMFSGRAFKTRQASGYDPQKSILTPQEIFGRKSARGADAAQLRQMFDRAGLNLDRALIDFWQRRQAGGTQEQSIKQVLTPEKYEALVRQMAAFLNKSGFENRPFYNNAVGRMSGLFFGYGINQNAQLARAFASYSRDPRNPLWQNLDHFASAASMLVLLSAFGQVYQPAVAWLKKFLYHEEHPVRPLWKARNLTDALVTDVQNMASQMPLLGRIFVNTFGWATPGTQMSAFGLQLFPLSAATSLMQALSKGWQTRAWGNAAEQLLRQFVPNSRVFLNAIGISEGTNNERALRNVLAANAPTGVDLKPSQYQTGAVQYSPARGAVDNVINALSLSSGPDMATVRAERAAGIQKLVDAGKTRDDAAQAFDRSIIAHNPFVAAYGRNLTSGEMAELRKSLDPEQLANLDRIEKGRQAYANAFGLNEPAFVKDEGAASVGRPSAGARNPFAAAAAGPVGLRTGMGASPLANRASGVSQGLNALGPGPARVPGAASGAQAGFGSVGVRTSGKLPRIRGGLRRTGIRGLRPRASGIRTRGFGRLRTTRVRASRAKVSLRRR